MELERIFEQIAQNQKSIPAPDQIPAEIAGKIEYKLRLDWNYHSLTMEGSRYTRAETQALMSGLVTGDRKTVQDVKEMIGHNEVLVEILKVANKEKTLTEKRIQALHKQIVYSEDPEEREQIGKWKNKDNYVGIGDEKDWYMPLHDVPEAMHKLLDKTNAEIDKYRRQTKDARHPLLIAFDFQVDFLHIHPFVDGNGRMARILTNIILIALDYPPIVVTKEDRKDYGRLLGDIQFRGASREAYYIFMGGIVLRSQELYLKALRGESLEEEGDLEKRLALVKRKMDLMGDANKVQVVFSQKVFEDAMFGWISELAFALEGLAKPFEDYFLQSQCKVSFSNSSFAHAHAIDDLPLPFFSKLEAAIRSYVSVVDLPSPRNTILRIDVELRELKQRVNSPLSISVGVEIWFRETDFGINFKSVGHSKRWTNRLYHQMLTRTDMDKIVGDFSSAILDEIEQYLDSKN